MSLEVSWQLQQIQGPFQIKITRVLILFADALLVEYTGRGKDSQGNQCTQAMLFKFFQRQTDHDKFNGPLPPFVTWRTKLFTQCPYYQPQSEEDDQCTSSLGSACPSVHPSVSQSVCQSVRPSGWLHSHSCLCVSVGVCR